MKPQNWRLFTVIFLIGLLVALTLPGVIAARNADGNPLQGENKIEAAVLEQLNSAGQTDFFIWMTEKADLSAAGALSTKEEKGQFVYETLRTTADNSQRELRAYLDSQNIRYHSLYIANKILVRAGTESLAMAIANRPDVARITANRPFQLQEPFINPNPQESTQVIEPNIIFVNADDVWAMGFTGQGTVMAGLDTGLDWDHPALINQYRGWDGATADHNYNWWDPTGTYPTVPDDGHGHGTHTTGTMVGDDGGSNQIGVAPGAQTIHCKGMDDGGGGSEFTFSECFEFFLAPWDLSGNNPNPDLAPDAINNSWGFFGGGFPAFQDEIAALQAAGIVVEVSAGNEGPGCVTLRSPGDYGEVLTTGSINHAGGTLPGSLTGFSSRGPSTLSAEFIPDIMAPGENINSSLPGGGYSGPTWSGTSMSGPHVTALTGLMWSANPGLRGLINETYQIIADTAVPLTGQNGSNCGGDYTTGPNNDWGFGTMDALAAVNTAILYGNPGTLDGTVTDSVTMAPLEGAHIAADLGNNVVFNATTNASGYYSTIAFSGTYTVSVSLFGYFPQTHPGIQVTEFQTTTLDVQLVQAPSFTVEGFVTDATTGWPLYAQLNIGQGFPNNPVWTDPVTGYYSVVLPAGTYDFTVNAFVAGYDQAVEQVSVSGNMNQDFALDANLFTCTAPGYTAVPSGSFFDDFESGYSNWTMTGLWNPENQVDSCGSMVAPFPSPTNAAYYGIDGICTFNNGSTNSGNLTMVSPVAVGAGSVLSFSTYEQTECGGPSCPYDARRAEISTNGGSTWTTIYDGGAENQWRQENIDLSPFAGAALIRFQFDTLDSVANDFFGWMVDDVDITTYTCVPPTEGGLVVGNVYDTNTNDPVVGAWVTNETGATGYAMTTPSDPNVDDAFYTVYSLAGSQVHTATFTLYGEDVQNVNVVDFDTVEQDFFLPSGFVVANPTDFDVSLEIGDNTTLPLTLSDIGGANVEFEIREVPGTNPNFPTSQNIPARDGNFPRGSHPTSIGAAPPMEGRPAGPIPGASLAQLLGSTAYGVEHVNLYYTVFDIDVPETLPFVSPAPPTGEFIGAGEYVNGLVYMIDTFNMMWEVDPATGTILNSYTATPPAGGQTYSGLAYDPTSGVVYAGATDCGNSTLYTIDPPTGVATQVGTVTNGGCLIALAVDGNGDLWGYDIIADVLLWIDKNTGAGTVIGSIGFDANFGQGMGWDPDTDTLYMAAFNDSAFQAELRSVDRNTGNTTLMGVLGQTTPGFAQVSWLGFEISESDVPWVSADPITGTVPANGDFFVDVTFDAAQVPIPGQYTAMLKVIVDAPQQELLVPLTLTATCPTCGTLEGNLTDAATGLSIVGSVHITSTGGFDFTLEDVSFYTIQLLPGQYYVTASAPGYLSETAIVDITTGATTVQDFALWPDTAILSFSPASVEESMEIGDVVSNTITVSNTGASPLEYEVRIGGYSGPFTLAPVSTSPLTLPASDGNFLRGEAAASFLAAPASEKSANSTDGSGGPRLLVGGAPAYGAEFFTDQFVTFTTDNPTSLTNINSLGGALYYGGDFIDGDFSTLFAVNSNDNILYAIDTATGVATAIGPMVPVAGGNWTGMSGDATSGVMYASSTPDCSTNTLYTVDLSTGTATSYATITGYCIIDIAINANGDMYAVDIVGDQLLAIDKNNGDVTVIGSIGFDANFAQGLDFDEEADILYLAAYNNTTVQGEFRIVDINTGNTTLVGLIGSGASELDAFAVATGGVSGPQWAYAVPDTGNVPGFSSTTFELVFDARSMYQVGDFYATLSFQGNFVNNPPTMPLTMHLSCPSCGFLEGAVTDAWTGDPLDADIHVTGPGGFDVMLSDNSYALAVQPGTYDFLVTADGYFDESASVTVASGQTVVTDFALIPIVALLEYSPAAYEQTVALGQVFTDSLVIHNAGTVPFDFELSDNELGNPDTAGVPVFVPAGQNVGSAAEGSAVFGHATVAAPAHTYIDANRSVLAVTNVLIVCADDNPCEPLGSILESYPDIGIVDVWNATLSTPTLADLLDYDVVITWSNFPYADGVLMGNVLADYVDAGGSVVHSVFNWFGSPFGLSGRFVTEGYSPFISQNIGNHYLDASLGSYDPSHPIMAGVSAATDFFRDWVDLHPDATLVASWDDGEEFVATKGNVVAINSYTGTYYLWTGDVGVIFHNAVSYVGLTDALWLHEDPVTGTVNPGESETVNIIFDTSVITQTGTYTAEIRFAGTFDNNVPPAQVVMHVVEAVHAVEMSGDQEASGEPGDTVAYTVWITNTGNIADTFNLALGGNNWSTTLSETSVTLAPGTSSSVTVSVEIPTDAADGSTDAVTVTATSVEDPGVSASATMNTTAIVAEYLYYYPAMFKQP